MLSPIVTASIAALLSLGSLSACVPGPCIEDGLEADKSYRVTFLEIYNESSTLAAWDPEILASPNKECARSLPPMASFDATVFSRDTESYPNGCTSAQLTLDKISWGTVIENDGYSAADNWGGTCHWHPGKPHLKMSRPVGLLGTSTSLPPRTSTYLLRPIPYCPRRSSLLDGSATGIHKLARALRRPLATSDGLYNSSRSTDE